jgi:hypothetical protein
VSLLSSPRRRRRLLWSSVVAGVVLTLVGIGLVTAPTAEEEPRSSGPGWAPPPEPRSVKRSAKSMEVPLTVAARFVATAVARKNIDDSWPLTSPGLRQGFTRARWATGEIPVVPFPVHSARWELDYSFEDSVGLKVALFPPARSEVRAAVFNIDLVALGQGAKRQWLVESFTPAGGTPPSGGGQDSGGALGLPDLGAARGERHLSMAWLLVPAGLLSLALLVPLAAGIVYWRRSRRIERDYARQLRSRSTGT